MRYWDAVVMACYGIELEISGGFTPVVFVVSGEYGKRPRQLPFSRLRWANTHGDDTIGSRYGE